MVLTKAGSILGPIATVLGYIMDILFRFTDTFGIMNVGLCIILFTIVMKMLMLPLTIKQQKTTKLMAVISPEVQAIQRKYKGKTARMDAKKLRAGLAIPRFSFFQQFATSGCEGVRHTPKAPGPTPHRRRGPPPRRPSRPPGGRSPPLHPGPCPPAPRRRRAPGPAFPR